MSVANTQWIWFCQVHCFFAVTNAHKSLQTFLNYPIIIIEFSKPKQKELTMRHYIAILMAIIALTGCDKAVKAAARAVLEEDTPPPPPNR